MEKKRAIGAFFLGKIFRMIFHAYFSDGTDHGLLLPCSNCLWSTLGDYADIGIFPHMPIF